MQSIKTTRQLTFLLVLLFAAVTPTHSAVSYKSVFVDDSNGMFNSYVRGIQQDDYGYLWLATLNGLCRYDGYSIKVIRPQDFERYRLMTDSRTVNINKWGGRFIWVSIRPQIYTCYDTKTDNFIDYTGDDRRLRNYYGYFSDPRALWLAHSGNGALRLTYKDGKFTCEEFSKKKGNLPTDDVQKVALRRSGKSGKMSTFLVLGCGLARYEGGHVQILDKKTSFKDVDAVGDAYYAVAYDGSIYRVCGNHLNLVTKIPATIKVLDAKSIGKRLVISTTGANYCFYSNAHNVVEASDIPGQNCKIMHDNKQNLVVYSSSGIFTYLFMVNGKTETKTWQLASKPSKDFRPHAVVDKQGNLWISVWGNGLYSYNPQSGQLCHYQKADANPLIKSNNILDLIATKGGRVVVSQENFGIAVISAEHDNLSLWTFPGVQSGSDGNGFRSLQYINGHLYGMNLEGNVAVYPSGKSGRPSFITSLIVTMYKSRNGAIWYGTRDDGAYCVSPSGEQIHYTGKQLGVSRISEFCEDNKGRIWIATFGGGLACVYNGKVYHFLNKGNDEQKECRVITKDHHGLLWIGTGQGVYIINPDKLFSAPKDMLHYVSNDFNPRIDEVHDIFEDSRHRIWIAYAGNGVSRIDNTAVVRRESLDTARHFSSADGLRTDGCASVCADKHGRIWVGSSPGLNLYNEKTGKFRQFMLSENPLANIVMQNSMILLPDGRIAYGSRDGIAFFNPSQVLKNSKNAGAYLFISNILVNGTDLSDLPNYQDIGSAFLIKDLELSHSENNVRFNFSDFKTNENGQFSYYLEGYDKTWSAPTTDNFAIYNNLPAGTYSFHVRIIDPDGDPCGKECTLAITINPPLWATWWAICLYGAFIAIVIAIVYKQIAKENRLRTDVKIEHELTELKLRMFTAISHEFRTPLTLIQGAMEHLHSDKHEIPASMRAPLDTMLKSVKRMNRLVNELMVFRKVNAGSMHLGVEETDVVGFVRNIYLTFVEMADNKHINYTIRTQASVIQAYIDRNKIDTIIYNLLSNAFKYTPQDGEVTLRVEVVKEWLEISVTDNGIGVPEEKRERMFDEFEGSKESYQSIGLGLHLAKQLAEVHHGELVYEDRGDGNHTGSRFSLIVPMDSNAYPEEEHLKAGHTLLMEERQQAVKEAEELTKPGYKEISGDPLNELFVLLVEDDDDVRDYVRHELDHYFHVVTGCNGEEALKVLEEHEAVDVIVTDYMMPVMDGIKFVKKVRNDERFAHLPIIMLTGMGDDKSFDKLRNLHLKGLNAGVDVFMEKPFSINILVAQISQLLKQSRAVASNIEKNIGVSEGNVARLHTDSTDRVTPGIITEERDRRMMSQIDSWLAQHISDPHMTVDDLAAAMGCGRSKLYAKMSELTGQTPNNYIRAIRMNMTKDLLRDTDLTVNEIAYKVGFSNSFYLSKCFKDTFGMSPTQYRKS